MTEPTYEMMLGNNLMGDESGGSGAPPLTANQMSALSARAGVPCGACGAYEPRRLCINLTALWAFGAVSFVLSIAALGVASSSSGESSVAKGYCKSAHQGTQLYGEDVIVGPDGCDDDVTATDGCHHYQIIGGSWAAITWHQAHADAQTRCFEGVQGHLVSIESGLENDWLEAKVMENPSYAAPSHAWLGATDLRSEGEFEWVGGKHSSDVFWVKADGSRAALEGFYSNWAPGEPNDAAAKEDCVVMDVGTGSLSAHWNDEPCYKPRQYFIVEFDV